jgi:hypothetical protein
MVFVLSSYHPCSYDFNPIEDALHGAKARLRRDFDERTAGQDLKPKLEHNTLCGIVCRLTCCVICLRTVFLICLLLIFALLKIK